MRHWCRCWRHQIPQHSPQESCGLHFGAFSAEPVSPQRRVTGSQTRLCPECSGPNPISPPAAWVSFSQGQPVRTSVSYLQTKAENWAWQECATAWGAGLPRMHVLIRILSSNKYDKFVKKLTFCWWRFTLFYSLRITPGTLPWKPESREPITFYLFLNLIKEEQAHKAYLPNHFLCPQAHSAILRHFMALVVLTWGPEKHKWNGADLMTRPILKTESKATDQSVSEDPRTWRIDPTFWCMDTGWLCTRHRLYVATQTEINSAWAEGHFRPPGALATRQPGVVASGPTWDGSIQNIPPAAVKTYSEAVTVKTLWHSSIKS